MWSPIIDLNCWMAEEQGVALDAAFYRELADELDLRASEARGLRDVWDRPDRPSIDDLGRTLAVRFPQLSADETIDILLEYLNEFGRPTPRARGIAATVALGFGVNPSEWERAAASLETPGSELDRQSAFAVLELEPDATGDEVRVAYRRLMRDYHPDRVADMPKGFRDFATQRAQEINAAYAFLTAEVASVRVRCPRCREVGVGAPGSTSLCKCGARLRVPRP